MHEALTTEAVGREHSRDAAGAEPYLITTPEGLPGFDTSRRWELEREPGAVFSLLHNLDLAGVGLMVAEPWELAPGYEPDLPDEELQRIDVHDARDVELLVVATLTSPDSSNGVVWLNLAAPIVINTRTRMARQVILDRQGWPMRHAIATRS